MAVQKVTAAKQHSPKALERAVDGAMKDIKKIQERMTRDLRNEDAIRGLSVEGGRVKVLADDRYPVKPAELKKIVSDLLAQRGVRSAAVDVVKFKSPEQAVEGAWNDIVQIQNRLTRELRAEDGIAGLKLIGKATVSVALKAHNPYSEDEIKRLVKEHLKANGLTGVRLEMVRPQIEPIPTHVVVAEAWKAIEQVQSRMTADMRAEDDIKGMNADHFGNEVRVVLGPRPYFSIDQIEAAAKKHLADAGLPNANITFIRPAVDPIRPPVVPPSQNTMKAKVDALQTHLEQVHGRLTEEIRVEDSVQSFKLQGTKVVVTLQRGAVDLDAAESWARQELKDRGITLPVVIKKDVPIIHPPMGPGSIAGTLDKRGSEFFLTSNGLTFEILAGGPAKAVLQGAADGAKLQISGNFDMLTDPSGGPMRRVLETEDITVTG